MHDTTIFCNSCGNPLLERERIQGACPRCLLDLGLMDEAQVAADDPLRLDVTEALPAFQILERLGRGGMGTVYKARQTSLGRTVALKILHPELSHREGFAERFQREARAMASLAHPGAVMVYEYGTADGISYLVQEYVDGGSLRDLIRHGVEPARAAELVAEVADALNHAHDQGVIHRDVKPENILLTRDGKAKVTDFGLARLVQMDPTLLTRSGQIMGTVHYMAPEQFERPTDVDHRADVYSLGVVLYEALTGTLPLGRFSPPGTLVKAAAPFDDAVMQALSKEPMHRHESMAALAAQLRRPVQGCGCPSACREGHRRPIRAAVHGATTPARRTSGRRTAWFTVLALFMICAIVGLLAVFLLLRMAAPSRVASSGEYSEYSEFDVMQLRDQGGSVLKDKDGLFLHPVAVEHLGLVPLQVWQFEEDLKGLHQRYLAAERAARTIENSEQGFRLEFTAFPEVRSQLADDLQALVRKTRLSTEAARALDLEGALFPFGYEADSVQVNRGVAVWSWAAQKYSRTSNHPPAWVERLWYEALGTEAPGLGRDEVLSHWQPVFGAARAGSRPSVAWLGLGAFMGLGLLLMTVLTLVWASRRSRSRRAV